MRHCCQCPRAVTCLLRDPLAKPESSLKACHYCCYYHHLLCLFALGQGQLRSGFPRVSALRDQPSGCLGHTQAGHSRASGLRLGPCSEAFGQGFRGGTWQCSRGTCVVGVRHANASTLQGDPTHSGPSPTHPGALAHPSNTPIHSLGQCPINPDPHPLTPHPHPLTLDPTH